jgi:hypothetical protein
VHDALVEYQATLSGWNYDFIPIWDTGRIQLKLNESGGLTHVECETNDTEGIFPDLVPLELALWILLLLVLAAFIFRALQAPTPGNILTVLVFALVPLFYGAVKLLLVRGTSSAVENILRQTLEKKEPTG